MKRACLILAALLLCGAHVEASAACPEIRGLEVYAFETITVADTAIGFTALTMAPDGVQRAQAVLITLETAAIRFRADGIAPSDTVGHPVSPGQMIEVCGERNVSRFKMIRSSATSGAASVTFYRVGP